MYLAGVQRNGCGAMLPGDVSIRSSEDGFFGRDAAKGGPFPFAVHVDLHARRMWGSGDGGVDRHHVSSAGLVSAVPRT